MQTPPLKITFLGTGTSSGVPMIACDCEVCTSNNPKDNRLRSSIMVQSETTTIVVDTTPDFRSQMLRAGVKKLDAVYKETEELIAIIAKSIVTAKKNNNL